MPLGKLNDSNPTRHGLAPALVPGTYTADPRGPRPAREALASFLTELHRGAEGAGTAPAADSVPVAHGQAEEALDFAGDGAVKAHFSWDKLENINTIFETMEKGGIDGRIVLNLN